MGYLTGTDSAESVGSAVCLKLEILAVLYLHKQTENHFCSHEGKQGQGGSVNPPEGSISTMYKTNAFGVSPGLISVYKSDIAYSPSLTSTQYLNDI